MATVTFSFANFQAVLEGGAPYQFPHELLNDSIAERIRQILVENADSRGDSICAAELLPLVRQYLLRESSRTGREMHLRIPVAQRWAELKVLVGHGFKVLPIDNAHLISALPWHPDWLKETGQGIFSDAFSEKNVRCNEPCDADPFIVDATGYAHYSCPGQREAVRSAFLMRAGESLIVNLPTGSGKSLVGQAPALVFRQEGFLTIFVVPTIALAIDQERQMQIYLNRIFGNNWPLAWYGGTSKEDRSQIRKRLRDGTQRILFTSPEALVSSLLRPVVELAKAGMLRYLVIDEAHLVTQWGDEFRPAFQALAGVRTRLLRYAPHGGFRTILLSATLTEETVDTLADLFGPRSQVQVISAVHLRPEPQYWFYEAPTEEHKFARVIEAIRFAPRPFILYVTKREDARKWHRVLRDQVGMRRIACFEGQTPDNERRSIIEKWVANQIDGVVATSAFGLGIDKSDVRSIIHATIPETLDRYYQEVGRGGRDGKPSISIIIFDRADWFLPERLAKPKIISDELGINRWRALFENAERGGVDNLIKVNLDAVPKHKQGSSEFNSDWNMRTLLLLCRAGVIELEIDNSDEPLDQSEDNFSKSLLTLMATVWVRILDHGHLNSDTWEMRVKPARDRSNDSASNSLRLMKNLLQGNAEVGLILSELYRIDNPSWPVNVTRVCGGCPVDRDSEPLYRRYHAPQAIPLPRVIEPKVGKWTERFPWLSPSLTCIFFDEASSIASREKTITRLATWLISECGVREIAASKLNSLSRSVSWNQLYRRSVDGIVLHRDISAIDVVEPYSPLGRLTVFEVEPTPEMIDHVRHLERPLHIIVLPMCTRDPSHSQRLFIHTTRNHLTIEQFMGEVTQ